MDTMADLGQVTHVVGFIMTIQIKETFLLYFQCIKILLDNGCSPDIVDNNGLTAAELARKCQHDSCADLIQSYVSQVIRLLNNLSIVLM